MKYLLGLVGYIFICNAAIAVTAKDAQVARVEPNSNGNIVVKLVETTFPEENCGYNQEVVIEGDEIEVANRLMSIALAAQAQKRNVRVYVHGCAVAFPWKTDKTAPVVKSLGIE